MYHSSAKPSVKLAIKQLTSKRLEYKSVSLFKYSFGIHSRANSSKALTLSSLQFITEFVKVLRKRVNNYFKDTAALKEKYGEKSIVLIQVGAFYEVYGLQNPETKEISGSNIADFSTSCELAISQKNICVGKKNVLMAGVRDYMLDKYLKKLQ